MLLKAFSIRDAKGEFFGNPFFQGTHGEAERVFRQAVNDVKTSLNQFPEDYDLYYVGEFDNHTGHFKACDTPQHLMKAIHCVKKDSISLV